MVGTTPEEEAVPDGNCPEDRGLLVVTTVIAAAALESLYRVFLPVKIDYSMLGIGCALVSVVHRQDMRRYWFCLSGLCVHCASTYENAIPSFLVPPVGLMGIGPRARSQ